MWPRLISNLVQGEINFDSVQMSSGRLVGILDLTENRLNNNTCLQ